MFEFDCALDPAATNDLIAACISARAGFEGALTSGILTIIAAFIALGGGLLAYLGVGRQVRLQEQNDRAHKIAYRQRMLAILADIDDHLNFGLVLSIEQRQRYRNGETEFPLTTVTLSLPVTFQEDQWKDHALLGEKAVKAMVGLQSEFRRAMAYEAGIKDQPASRYSGYPSDLPPKNLPDGSVEVFFEPAAEAYVRINEDLKAAIGKLRNAL